MAQNWWDSAPVVGQPPQRQGRVFADPYKESDEQRRQRESARQDEELRLRRDTTALAIEAAKRDAIRDARAPLSASYDQTTGLSKTYNADPAVKSYRGSLASYASGLRAPANAEGDLSLVYSFAKIMDPDSVVREGEAASVGNSSPTIEALAARIKKEFGMDEGGQFSPDARERLKNAMKNRVASYNQAYVGTRDQYRKQAEAFGLDPMLVIGEHAGIPFQKDEEKFLRRPVKTLDAQGNVVPVKDEYKTLLQGGTPFDPSPNEGLSVDVSEEVRPGHPDYERMKAAQDQRQQLERQAIDAKNIMLTQSPWGGANSLMGQGAAFGLGDEASGVGSGIASVLSGGTFPQGYNAGRDLENKRLDELRKKYGVLGTAAEIGGALLTPFGAGSAAAQLPRGVQALRGARIGAATGGLTGFGYGEGAQGRAAGALGGSLLGGGLGAAGGALFGGNRAPADLVTPEQRAIANAAQAEGVRISRPIADESRRGAMGFLESTVGGGGPVRRSLQNTADDLEARAGALGGAGTVQERGVLGQAFQSAGQRFIDRSRDLGGRLYDRAAAAAGRNPVRGQEAVQTLDQQIAELSGNANANAPLIDYLQALRSDFVDANGQIRPKDVGSIRDLRTSMRGQISSRNLTATDADRRVGMVLDAARNDIARDLGQSAPNAVRLYDRADQFWRQRSDEIKQVVSRVIGNNDDRLGGEQVFNRIKAMAAPGGDSARLRRMVDKLSPEEQADYASTVAASLGRRSAEEEFSPALFVSSVRALSPGARRVIFGADGARSINNLRLVAENFRNTEQALNRSRSGVVQNWANFYRGLLAPGGGAGVGVIAGGVPGGLTGAAIGAAATAAGAGIKNLSARALMNHDMSRWLAAGARLRTPAQIANHAQRLSTIAARNPAIQSEIQALQQGLLNFANDNAGQVVRSAASPLDEEEKRKNQRPY